MLFSQIAKLLTFVYDGLDAGRYNWQKTVRAWLQLKSRELVPGLIWLGHLVTTGMFDPATYASVWEQTIAWGLTPFLIGDAIKLALAAVAFPMIWKLIGDARS